MKTALASLLLLSNSKLALNCDLDLRRAMVYIAVLRIMQAFTEDFAYCCVTLKVPHLFAVATLLPSVAPSVALLFFVFLCSVFKVQK